MSTDTLIRLCEEAPDDYGLLITLDESSTCVLAMVPDKHLEQIHPNAYGPASLYDLSACGGGGSGVSVFEGRHPLLGDLVMKHGSHKDTDELFALATIQNELQKRRRCNESAMEAASDMQSRIPEFRMLYISPKHLRDTPRELWRMLSKALRAIIHSHENSEDSERSNGSSTGDLSVLAENGQANGEKPPERSNCRRLRLYSSGEQDTVKVELVDVRSFQLVLGCSERVVNVEPVALRYGPPLDGYPSLQRFMDTLIPFQKKRLWKFTQGQKTIGHPGVKTGVELLASGELHGEILDALIREYVEVIRNLQQLTLPEERDIVEQIRKEFVLIEADPDMGPMDISEEADAFVGFAIKKNWHPDKGRFIVLRRMGFEFRSNKLILTPDEVLPAQLLGRLLKQGSAMSDVFEGAPDMPPCMDFKRYSTDNRRYDTWRAILKDAISLKSPAALKRVWSCGVADGGLHNLFLSRDKMWLFDMGEPTLQPIPGFLTKFLFSFFHGLGMVDDPVNGGWVNRFIPGDKLKLTPKTQRLIPQSYHAFKVTVDSMVEILFDGEQAVRGPLINYVTLQLMSDAAFCLNRWVVKGGGKPRDHNHHKHIEQWLWRALWDLYIASDLNTEDRLRYIYDEAE